MKANSSRRGVVCAALLALICRSVVAYHGGPAVGELLSTRSSFRNKASRSFFVSSPRSNTKRRFMHSSSSSSSSSNNNRGNCRMHGEEQLGVGFDFGTSGVRAVVVNHDGDVQFDSALRWAAPDDPDEWLRAADTLMGDVPLEMRKRVSRICFSGTSASCLLVDAFDPSRVTRDPRMYSYNTLTEAPEVAGRALRLLEGIAPVKHTTLSGTSALMKLVCWHLDSSIEPDEAFCHQADYVAAHATGARGPGSIVSDWNNALKAGFDVEGLEWPGWLLESELGGEIRHCLPEVAMPGAVVALISATTACRFGLPATCEVIAGTTDSIAAFIAANATTPGHAVTSLGSTLAVKMLSECRVEDASLGVYSHRLGHAGRRKGSEETAGGGEADRQGNRNADDAGSSDEEDDDADLWLVGGASNVGCAVLRVEGFESRELEALSRDIDPSVDSPLEYYPLQRGTKGERFPVNDPLKESVLEPRPGSRTEYLHGLLQAIARVESEGYAALEALGATKLKRVDTAGGGAVNPTWMALRQRLLGVPTGKASNTDAAYGCALLAMQGLGGARAAAAPAPTPVSPPATNARKQTE
ncbi:unnamed protein product [Pylaiella littoralis]